MGEIVRCLPLRRRQHRYAAGAIVGCCRKFALGEVALLNGMIQKLRVFRETLGAHLPGYVRNILSVLGEMELNIHREEVLKRLTNPNTQPDLSDRPA